VEAGPLTTIETGAQPAYEGGPLLEARISNDAEQKPPLEPTGQASEKVPPAITVDHVATNEDTDTSRKGSAARTDDDLQDLDRFKSQSTEASGLSGDQENVPTAASCAMALRRPHSCDELNYDSDLDHRNEYWPRHLSFSTVEEVVLARKGLDDNRIFEKPDASLEEAIIHEDVLASDARISAYRIRDLEMKTVPWVENQVSSVDKLNQRLYETHEQLSSDYLERFELYQQVREKSSDLLAGEHAQLTEPMRRVEMLGAKLDYELHALESKVEDVETGLGEFERHVDDIEQRVKSLVRGEEEKQNYSWLAWLFRLGGW
jgi:hypothetical protein